MSTATKHIRDVAFGRRLELACDQAPHCPPLHQGRLRWIADEFERRFKTPITTETVRKWVHGESKPRQEKNELLAKLLQVDPSWLYFGIDPDLEPRERKVRNAIADGAVNVVAGLIAMDGGYPAFPETEGAVDLHAIIKGAKYDFHITVADEDGRYVIPTEHEDVIVLGMTRKGFSFEIVELTPEVIATGNRRGGSIEVVGGGRPITGFTRRL